MVYNGKTIAFAFFSITVHLAHELWSRTAGTFGGLL